MTRRDRWQQRPAVIKYYQFKDDIIEAAINTEFQLGERFVAVFMLPMPKSWSKKKKVQMALRPHRQVPDTDNLIKALADCLLTEDSHVWDMRGVKLWANEGAIYIKNLET
jgi:Holliday junction resolvase RusA-like endonuclease